MWFRSKRPEPSIADALDVLAGLLRAGTSIRAALTRWHVEAPPSFTGSLRELDRLLTLGMSPVDSLSGLAKDERFRAVAHELAGSLSVAERVGADASAAVARIAAEVRDRAADTAAAVAAASGARVSGRLVAGLPIAFLVLMPFRRVEMLDRADLYLVLAGVGLAVAGMRWIDKLVPDPQGFDDPLLSFVSNIERSIGAGLGIRTALSTSTERSTDERLRVVAALVSAGATWHVALQRSPDPFLRALAPIVSRAERLGTPVAFEIDRLLVARRDELARLFDIQLRRAPVLMMVPLTLCVLPAYALLAFGPFLRGLGIPMG